MIYEASNIVTDGVRFLPFVTAGAATTTTAFKSFVKVPQGHVGMRTRVGRARKVNDSRLPWGRQKDEFYGLVRPGLHAKVPFTHGIDVISTQDRTSPLEPMAVDSKSDRQHQVRSSVTWGVVPEYNDQGEVNDYGVDYEEMIFRALYKVQGSEALTEKVTGICVNGLRKVLLEEAELKKVDAGCVQENLIMECQEELWGVGVELRRLNLYDTAYTGADLISQKMSIDTAYSGVNAIAASQIVPDLLPYRATG